MIWRTANSNRLLPLTILLIKAGHVQVGGLFVTFLAKDTRPVEESSSSISSSVTLYLLSVLLSLRRELAVRGTVVTLLMS